MMAGRVSCRSSIEVGIRRARGKIACAECRRLKLKCDKKLPCSSCVRRGYSSICPNGTLITGHGTRAAMVASTLRLHSKIAEMGQRMRQLEDAIAILHSAASNEPHPLLHDELMTIKSDREREHPMEEKEPVEEGSVALIDAIGTLTISDYGESKYFGRSAGPEILLLFGTESMTGTEPETGSVDPQAGFQFELPRIFDYNSEGPPGLTLNLTKMSSTFPFGVPNNQEKDMDLLLSYLPHQARAWSLFEVYMEQGAWSFRPVHRDEILDILIPVYKALKERNTTKAVLQESMISAHKLAALFLIFALGSLLDLTLEPFNIDADRYYYLGRACLSIQDIFDSSEVATVQAIMLMAAYHSMCGKKYALDNTWSLLSLGSKLAQSLGLHRDGARWNMDVKFIELRRSLFWEIYSIDVLYCFSLGRPPSIRLSYVDCEFPKDHEATLDTNGNVLVGFHRWKYEFTKEVVAKAVELILGVDPPTYQTILDFDRKVHEKILPSHLNVFMSPDDARFTPSIYMQGCTLSLLRAQALLLLHKDYFTQAILNFPDNPLQSPYAPSFLAAYRCASSVINTCQNIFDRFPDLSGRWWFVWTFLFTASVIVGTIATRSPSSSIASSAFVEFGVVCDLYEYATVLPPRARSAKAMLRKVREKANIIHSPSRTGHVPAAARFSGPDESKHGDDELALFGGQTRVLVLNLLSARNPIQLNEPSSALSLSSSSLGSDYKDTEIHPSLFEYLLNFVPEYVNLDTQVPIPFEGPSDLYSPPLPGRAYQVENWLQSGQGPEVGPYSGGPVYSEAPLNVNVASIESIGQTVSSMMAGGGLGMDLRML